MKTEFVFTLEGNEDFLRVKTKKQEICEVVPKGKTTTARIIGEGLHIHIRRALKYLSELEKDGFFSSDYATVKNKSNVRCKTRVFKRL